MYVQEDYIGRFLEVTARTLGAGDICVLFCRDNGGRLPRTDHAPLGEGGVSIHGCVIRGTAAVRWKAGSLDVRWINLARMGWVDVFCATFRLVRVRQVRPRCASLSPSCCPDSYLSRLRCWLPELMPRLLRGLIW